MKKLLIANRGEIAIRIQRAAADLGIATVAVFSEDDATSLHVRRADESVALQGRGPKAYLDGAAVIAAAKAAGADAIHPGYGFLSEVAAFASAVAEAGLTFVGPPTATLALVGDKGRARQFAQEVGLPVLKGADALDVAGAHAFFASLPKGAAMLLKAVYGGGGRGVRKVEDPDTIEAAFAEAAMEAKAAFGDGALYAEEFLPDARHLEVQILGDGQSVSHLGERECTLQRRRQKILEIAPSPTLSEAVRTRMIAAAVKLGEAARYRSLGTIEFLLAADGERFVFIEANPRLQVEHTVTEEVYGVDLVRAQLEIAAGKTLKALGLDKAPAAPRGYAIQARINLETLSVDGTVRPAGGRIGAFEPPGGPGVRTDSYAAAGYETNPAFDSLIAKLIVHSPSPRFADAIAKLTRALSEFRLEGPATNIPVLQALLADPRVRENAVTTTFVDEALPAIAASLVKPKAAPSAPLDPLAVLEAGSGGGNFKPLTDYLDTEGPAIRAPMQGAILSLSLSVGDKVWAGKTVGLIEAMKMHHEIRASAAGVVTALTAAAGETVYEGHVLATLAEDEVHAPDAAEATAQDLDRVRPDLAEALARRGAGHDENRPDAVAKRHAKNQRTARENIADLCDPGTFVEYGSVTLAAQRRRRTMEDLIANTTGDGMVCGLGQVNGADFPPTRARVVAMSYDYMVLAGTQGKLNHYKKDRMFEIAARERLPVVLFAEGGGGRPGDTDATGVAGLDCLAFNYFARLSGSAPLVGIVSGRCFAGNAVLLGCCDVIIATEGANIGIGGPAMIEGGGLGVFRPEDVGPMDVQTPNGVVDVAVKDEAEAVAVAKKYLAFFQGATTGWRAPDSRALRFAVPEDRMRWYDMRNVISGIADVGSTLELRRDFGVGVITTLARIEGRPIGIIANNPGHLSGAIDAPGADKAARFMQLCDAFDIPILTLIDCPGIMVGPEIEKTALVRHACRLMVVGANIETPLISIVVRKGYGLGAQAMAGGSFRAPMMIMTWPTGEFGGMGLEGAVKLGFRKELQAIADLAERRTAYEKMVAASYERGKAVNMASHFEVDDVIDPAQSRACVLAALDAAAPAPPRHSKKRRFIDTW